MTEAEWLARAGAASERKLRLFVCVCCRGNWDLLDDPARQAVEVAEAYADGVVSDLERHAAFVRLMHDHRATALEARHFYIAWPPPTMVAAAIALADGTESLVDSLSGRCETGLGPGGDGSYRASAIGIHLLNARWFAQDARRRSEQQAYGHLRRAYHTLIATLLPSDIFSQLASEETRRNDQRMQDLVGSPPFRSVVFDKSWCSGAVASIAQAIYTERAFDDLPILADALEDAGCTDAAILDHCRQPGEHARGCWVVDLVLGKE